MNMQTPQELETLGAGYVATAKPPKKIGQAVE